MTTTSTHTVTSKALKNSLRFLVKANRPAFIWGPPGVGKSSVVEELCNEMGGKLYDVRLSQVDQVDLRGMPFFNKETAMMEWAPPVDLPTAEEAAQYPITFLFLDEMNSAAPSIQAAAYQLVLSRKIGTYTLPDNCYVVAAGNRSGDRGVVFNMAKPLANRFIHFEMRSDFDSWNEWAISAGVHPDVVGFLNYSKSSLNDFDPKSPDHAFSTSRTWEFVSDVLKSGNMSDTVERDILIGTIGEGMALKFNAHRKISGKLPTPTEVLTGKVKEMKIKENSAQYAMITGLMYELKELHPTMKADGEIDKWHGYCDNMLSFIMDNMDTEIQVAGMRNAMQVMNIPFDHTKMSRFNDFYTTTGKIFMKSTQIK